VKHAPLDDRFVSEHPLRARSLSDQPHGWRTITLISATCFVGGIVCGGNLASVKLAEDVSVARARALEGERPTAGWVATQARMRQTIIDLRKDLEYEQRKDVRTPSRR
jgi:hypothetical protein